MLSQFVRKNTIKFIGILFLLVGCKSNNTSISIQNKKWHLNQKIINESSKAEGLLINVRMVNAVFEDLGEEMPNEFRDFNPDENTETFISKIPEYMAAGVNAFTICMQGGMPGYEGAINSAYNADGSLRSAYLSRIEKVINEANENNAVIILTCFYQRQHDNFLALQNKKAIKNAVKNTVNWIENKKFENVLLEISNEYDHGGFKKWNDGDWISSADGQVELINFAKSASNKLLVSTSGLGHGKMDEKICKAADYITIHFNGTSHQDIPDRINNLKKWNKPIVCNEDDKTGSDAVKALQLSVENGCSWGYMNNDVNQYMPFQFQGIADDSLLYRAIKNITSKN